MKTYFALALDINEKERFQKIVDETKEFVDIFKVGPISIFSIGLNALKYITDSGKEIFLDMKFFDIPSVVARTIYSLKDFNIKILTVHASGGEEIIRSSVESAQSIGIDIAAVTILTSENSDLEDVIRLSKTAEKCGAKWVVCQPQFAQYVKKETGLKIISPGIRLSDEKDDHKNPMSPAQAKALGVDMIVVGRPVILSPNPKEQAKKIKQMIET
ncbi:MAG: orotidine-5'-phosphate decarboxylase [Candidatus Calescibacterium sp.]|nr:orotidine-5'-phosphate decarboxylase [Candidatus Calescibacterium sp.]MCX7733146.1 orotidine-5'-phosphate decarboxylase [bacterium]MDW8087700.1 orotidine-5'-phosphate decarboxylase [Candidatus Calescibacterium sp.]